MSDMGFTRGMWIGMIAGTAVGMMLAPKKKCAKHGTGKVLKAAGEIVEQISDAIGL